MSGYVMRNEFGAFCSVCQSPLGLEEDDWDECDTCGGDGLWPHDEQPDDELPTEARKVSYRGYEIVLSREPSLGGDQNLYYSIFRESDVRECVSNFTSGAETLDDFERYMKNRIDEELASDDPWGESEDPFAPGASQ